MSEVTSIQIDKTSIQIGNTGLKLHMLEHGANHKGSTKTQKKMPVAAVLDL